MQTTPNEEHNRNTSDAGQANASKGPQGVDKAPGEEPSEDNVQFVQQTQKGKTVDGDPSKNDDRPSEQHGDL